MPRSTWDPEFTYDSDTLGTVLSDSHSIHALYTCLQSAFGPHITMDDSRQTSTQRRNTRVSTEIKTNNNINNQAAKMTKCIVNYMASNAKSDVFEQENLLATTSGTGLFSELEHLEVTGDDGSLWLNAESDNLVDLYWEINYLAAPVSTITFDPPADPDDD